MTLLPPFSGKVVPKPAAPILRATAFITAVTDDYMLCGYRLYIGGSLVNLVDTMDMLDGKAIAELRFDSEGLDGSRFAFTAVFEDGTQSVYSAVFTLAAVSEPSTLALLTAGLVLLRWRQCAVRGRRACSARR